MVESFQYRQILGWVVAPRDVLPVRVTLHVNDMEIAATWADEPSTRNTWSAARGFRIALGDIWDYCKTTDRVTVRIDGRPLPIAQKGIYKRPGNDGQCSLADLKRKFENGYIFSHSGWLQLSKKLDAEWQNAVLGLYARVSEVVKERFGYDPFVMYGTLLGLVRDGSFIGHDNDFDAAYISSQSDGSKSAAEMRDIGLALIDAGFDVECKRTALHVHDETDPELRVDLFHLFFDEDGELAIPFGVAGETTYTRKDWRGLVDAELAGHAVRVPAHAETLVEHIYGPSWRTPIAGFHWDRARTKWRKDGWTRDEYREEVYWANFYAHHELPAASTFFEFVCSRDDVPHNVLDIGCGDGRDTFAFARIGWRARGLDRSQVGVDHAMKRAVDASLAEVLSFVAGDVADASTVRSIVKQARDAADGGALLFYMRFFLHSITEQTQETLMTTLAEVAQPGDALAAEFRTEKDAQNRKVYGNHYRRYQDGFAFGEALRSRFGFEVVHEEEGTGLAPYQDEDPVLYRVIARVSPADNAR